MAIKHMVWVFNSPEPRLGERLVLLALADNAGDDTGIAWPSVQTLMAKAGMSERQVRRCLRELEKKGFIHHVGYHQKYGTNVYKMGWLAKSTEGGVNLTGGSNGAGSSHDMAPKPSSNRHYEKELPKESAEFLGWLQHHEEVTSYGQPKPRTKVRAETRAMFDARLSEGYTVADLHAATVGAYTDDYRRENGYYDTISVLRPTRIGSLIERGKRKPSQKRGERASRKVHTEKGLCAKCGADVTPFQMNNQSRMCDDCYERFENGG